MDPVHTSKQASGSKLLTSLDETVTLDAPERPALKFLRAKFRDDPVNDRDALRTALVMLGQASGLVQK